MMFNLPKSDQDRSSLLFIHMGGWLIFIAYEVGFISLSTQTQLALKELVVYYALNITLFYVHALLIMPTGIASRRFYLLLPMLILVELLIYLLIKNQLDCWLSEPSITDRSSYLAIKRFLVYNAFRGIYISGVATLYWAIRRMIRFMRIAHISETEKLKALKDKAELERDLIEAQNAHLRLQINPHFLFNTLNFIHNTYYKTSREASECIVLLAEILRFALEDQDKEGKILISHEAEQIVNFIELNQVRYDHTLNLQFTTEGDLRRNRLIPLILLTLTENVFKHAYLKDQQHPATIHLSIDADHTLHFRTWNIKRQQSAVKRLRSLGIDNVIKRLDHYYPDQYQLTINNREDTYELHLTVHLC